VNLVLFILLPFLLLCAFRKAGPSDLWSSVRKREKKLGSYDLWVRVRKGKIRKKGKLLFSPANVDDYKVRANKYSLSNHARINCIPKNKSFYR
jgi:hypothetical protein